MKWLTKNALNNLRVITSTRKPDGEHYLCPNNIDQSNVHLIDIIDSVAEINEERKSIWDNQKLVDTQKEVDIKSAEQLEREQIKEIDIDNMSNEQLFRVLKYLIKRSR